nr:histidine phosphatase family protein [uncultured Rhodopila sp.]
MRVILIRHPRPLIAPGICYGRLDMPLHPDAGPVIARISADSGLKGATRVWSSPARRCRVLADAIGEALAVPVTLDHRLQELDLGDWEGRPWDEVARADLDRWAAEPIGFAPPGGESGGALIARIREFEAALHRYGQECVVVSHGGPLKVLAALLSGKPVDLLAPAPPVGDVHYVSLPGLR